VEGSQEERKKDSKAKIKQDTEKNIFGQSIGKGRGRGRVSRGEKKTFFRLN